MFREAVSLNLVFRNSVQEIVDEYTICDEVVHLPK
jgi:hypothetical protein